MHPPRKTSNFCDCWAKLTKWRMWSQHGMTHKCWKFYKNQARARSCVAIIIIIILKFTVSGGLYDLSHAPVQWNLARKTYIQGNTSILQIVVRLRLWPLTEYWHYINFVAILLLLCCSLLTGMHCIAFVRCANKEAEIVIVFSCFLISVCNSCD